MTYQMGYHGSPKKSKPSLIGVGLLVNFLQFLLLKSNLPSGKLT